MGTPILPLPVKISRDGDIYESFEPSRVKSAKEESYVVRDIVCLRDQVTYVAGFPKAKPDVIPVLWGTKFVSPSGKPTNFFESLEPGDELIVETEFPRNGTTQERAFVKYTDIVFEHGQRWPVIDLRSPLHSLPKLGSDIYKVLGDDESLVSEKATESHHKILNKYGTSPFSPPKYPGQN